MEEWNKRLHHESMCAVLGVARMYNNRSGLELARQYLLLFGTCHGMQICTPQYKLGK
jgi:hypothetical protein